MTQKRQTPLAGGAHHGGNATGDAHSTAPHHAPVDTWALPLLKQKLLDAEHVTQPAMLAETNGKAWRLSAAIYHLTKQGWDILRYDRDGIRVYHLNHAEIQRLRIEAREAAA